MAAVSREIARKRRHERVRKKVSGTAERPRLNVYRSLDNIYAQVIDDSTGNTLVSASTVDKELRGQLASLKKSRSGQGGRQGRRRACTGEGHQGSSIRPRRLSLSWPRQGIGRRQP